MIKGKKGLFFGLYMVILTLFLCGSVIFLHINQERKMESSLVSPAGILALRDDYEIFEYREIEIIKRALDKINSKLDIKSAEFKESFRTNFFDLLGQNNKMKDFLIKDAMLVSGEVIKDSARADFLDYSKNIVYPEKSMKLDGNKLIFKRVPVGKYFILKSDIEKISFPVEVRYVMPEKEYIISKSGDKYKVEVA